LRPPLDPNVFDPTVPYDGSWLKTPELPPELYEPKQLNADYVILYSFFDHQSGRWIDIRRWENNGEIEEWCENGKRAYYNEEYDTWETEPTIYPVEPSSEALALQALDILRPGFGNALRSLKEGANQLGIAGGQGDSGGAEHTKGKRPSTEEQHEEGQARRNRDRGGEKGDVRRPPPRVRPHNWRGSWPPK
jgi:hypothetical protein